MSLSNREFRSVGRLNMDSPVHVRIKSEFDKGDILKGNLIVTMNPSDAVLLELLKDFLVAVDESQILQSMVSENDNEAINGASLDIKLNGMEAAFSISFASDSKPTAEKLARNFQWLFQLAIRQLSDRPEAQFYLNSKIYFVNNQVFIVAKMPRVSLDKYLEISNN